MPCRQNATVIFLVARIEKEEKDGLGVIVLLTLAIFDRFISGCRILTRILILTKMRPFIVITMVIKRYEISYCNQFMSMPEIPQF